MTPSIEPSRRFMGVLFATVIGAAAAGYFAGTRPQPEVRADGSRPEGRRRPTATAAVTYSEMEAIARGPNARWDSAVERMADRRANLLDKVEQTPEQKQAILLARNAHRAFDGAPPTVPHPIAQQTAASCIACHGQGLVAEGIRAPKMSHAAYASCTQCHVESDNRFLGGGTPLADNSFAGLRAGGAGKRAWQGAPPEIPHATLMRSDCMSCHGTGGYAGLRTTHPWRQSCTQCHAPSAELDQLPSAGATGVNTSGAVK